MALSRLLGLWRETPAIADNVAAWRTIPAQAAQTAPLPPELHPALARALRQQGIEQLYSHQATAWQQVEAGQHPVIVTRTASGKTLAYTLPVLHRLLTDPTARSLYLFPTKALAHDQQTALQQLLNRPEPSQMAAIGPATYDGDTPAARRPAIRRQSRLVLSNPDMLHTAVLPHHTKWADFFRRLNFVVIDEMHVYRGVFGSHVANVLRRLRRIARFYGASPQFILTSATIANPARLAEQLIEAPPVLIDNDGAASGAKHFLIYNPPVVNPDLGLRRSALQESIRLSRELLENDVQTIIFGRTRRTVELLLTYLREAVDPADRKSLRAYRSGYLPRQRRAIEQGLRQREVRAVVATSALELGIDIGRLDAAILTGYPGTMASTWQQAGRAGRQQKTALAVLVASASPLDQFLAHHPDYFFGRSPEQALINPNNLLILLQHLRCAAFELPFQADEPFGRLAPDTLAEFLHLLESSGDLHRSGPKYFWMADRYPAEQVSLRSASPERVQVLVCNVEAKTDTEAADTQWRTLGYADRASAPWMLHPQAIYLHEGQSYRVETLDLEQGLARLYPAQTDYFTEPKQETTISLIESTEQAAVHGAVKNHGEILVTRQVVGYSMVRWYSHERLGHGEVDLPPGSLHTTGYWLALHPDTVDSLRAQGLWSNDPNHYGPNWGQQRNAARTRDGYRCQMCGAPEQGRQHDVHHKVPFRQFDDYRQANRLANLLTLCRPCHGRAETAVRMRSGLSGLATALGHLAPLFLMCAPQDIGLFAEPQSTLAEGGPAVVIFDQIPAGAGFSQGLFEQHDTLVAHARDLVVGCGCRDGCPSCVGPAGEAGAGGKQEALALLRALT